MPIIDNPLYGRKKTMWITFLIVVALSVLLMITG